MKFITYIYLLLTMVSTAILDTTDYESLLREDIIAKLPNDVFSRPIHVNTNITQVLVYFAISHIIGLDPKTETFSVNGWVWHHWDDHRVIWDRADYGGLRTIRLPEDSVWKPKLSLFNIIKISELNNVFGESDIIAIYDGSLRWSPPLTSNTFCPMDFHWFPYDQHDCFLEFGPWGYAADEVNLTVSGHLYEETELFDFGDVNNEWELIKIYRQRHQLQPDYPYSWHTARVNVQVRRRAPYYKLLLILPIIMGIFLCLIVFWIPPTVKPTVIAFNLIQLTLFIAHIFWVIPRNGSSAPAILILASNTLALVTVSLIFSRISFYLSRRVDQNFPVFLQNLLNGFLGNILCLPSRSPNINAQSTDPDNLQADDSTANKNVVKFTGWMLLATALDRLMFIIYLISFFIVILVAFC